MPCIFVHLICMTYVMMFSLTQQDPSSRNGFTTTKNVSEASETSEFSGLDETIFSVCEIIEVSASTGLYMPHVYMNMSMKVS